jgi:hypothetical protein
MIWTVVLVLGVFGAFAGGVVYIFQHPEILTSLQDAIKDLQSPKEVPDSGDRKRVGYRAGPKSFTEQMDNLPPDTLLTIRDPETGNRVELQVVTCETFFGRKQYGGSQDWKRSGENWDGIICKGPASFSRTDILILNVGNAGYLFRKRVPMGAEESNKYRPFARQFASKDQTPGSVFMPYKENTYNLQDIGMWNIEGKDADGHIPENMLARWILASNDAGKAILIEDETEGTADSVWVGNVVDLNSVVVDVLTKQG